MSGVRPASKLLIGAGGGLGSLARYELGLSFAPASPGSFPWTTFAINLSGAFALGGVVVLILGAWPRERFIRSFVAIGFLGGFTTFSTFCVEAVRLVALHRALVASAYVTSSLTGGIMMVALGSAVVGRLTSRP